MERGSGRSERERWYGDREKESREQRLKESQLIKICSEVRPRIL